MPLPFIIGAGTALIEGATAAGAIKAGAISLAKSAVTDIVKDALLEDKKNTVYEKTTRVEVKASEIPEWARKG